MNSSRSFVISDIHGCYHTFIEMLTKIGINKSDKLVMIGDFVNRGKHSKLLLDYLIDNPDNLNFIPTVGNHEYRIIHPHLIQSEKVKAAYKKLLVEFKSNSLLSIETKYLDWIKGLPFYYKDEDKFFVHAGFDFSQSEPFRPNISMLTNKNWNINKKFRDYFFYHGHIPNSISDIKKQLRNLPISRKINIDAGCCYKEKYGNLCCLNYIENKLFFVKNKYD